MNELRAKLDDFIAHLQEQEKSLATMQSYKKDIEQLLDYAGDEPISKALVIAYKKEVLGNLAISTQNRKIISCNKFLRYAGLDDATVQNIRLQKNTTLDNVMSRSDYERCLRYAIKLDRPIAWHIMKTLAGTGIRIGELKHITIEAVKEGKAVIHHKGKVRVIPINKELAKLLKAYAKERGITKGIVFRTANDTPIDRNVIHKELKRIAGQARVNKSKVHAHAFRHLFAIAFLEAGNNITELADILGHSSLETTRIYTRTTTKDKAEKIAKLGL